MVRCWATQKHEHTETEALQLSLSHWSYEEIESCGVNTARLVRTGIRALTYGSSITGVPNGLMHSQRQTVAAMTSPGAGTGGQNLDMAMVIADESPTGRADPHTMLTASPFGSGR